MNNNTKFADFDTDKTIVIQRDDTIKKIDLFKAYFEISIEQTTKLHLEDVPTYLKAIGEYNEFSANKVIRALDEFDALVPRAYYNANNPNNGARDYSIRVGREGSPVLYINVYNLAEHRATCDFIKTHEKDIQTIFQRTKADEISFEHTSQESGTNSYGACQVEIRIWWD